MFIPRNSHFKKTKKLYILGSCGASGQVPKLRGQKFSNRAMDSNSGSNKDRLLGVMGPAAIQMELGNKALTYCDVEFKRVKYKFSSAGLVTCI
ncbi:hypothetical protein NPIL_613621 [Nephila pilipes]|uniref:Uncharacterized protein n=1 Tax=Nephila pilipes TaxID=299642 RepID=A0A8X6QUB2_NEPPI|nr:hypothetical protein NPIL_613621 [Nephila pilipes]